MLRDMSAPNSVDTSIGSITANGGTNCNNVNVMFGAINGLMPNNGSSTDESSQLHEQQTCENSNGLANMMAQSNVATNGSSTSVGPIIDNSNAHVVNI